MLLLTAAEAGTAKAAELDGELLECCSEASRLQTRADKLVAGLLPVPPLAAAWWEADCLQKEAYSLLDRAISLPARTPEGLQAKARVVIARLGPDSLAGHMAMSLARDVLGRAGA